ncbi:hypothetical protein [Microcoleus sp. PH2017_20_SFW_D_A]|uniref:hypothetical protein n=1 Tax=Microcoleus sp. PH2017_20_SFW_D_A TaxID=2798831 RepID=UPI001D9D428D|nr:hypothetical protein [Microcoleus sp. PH2017_20_SFW_D_A]MCC3507471.1 hypothetical protein [Microcoleus sp. PH2017_19_SFW_U_A]MCC3526385.1 hypothetical protein [Microcoleus sp. PH2017_20_SFW_D_A]
MSTNLLGELAANNGTYFFSGGDYDGKVDQIIVRGLGITGIRLYITFEGEPLNVTNNYLFHGEETILPDGLRITPKGDDVFTSVQILVNTGVENGTGLELVLSA